MRILLIEPYLTGSHRLWAEGLKRNSRHNIEILSLPGRWWKWRMQGGGLVLGRRFRRKFIEPPDLILASDMLDLPNFILTSGLFDVPKAIYFHENQITYPWKDTDRDITAARFRTYGMINIKSALAADRCLFNSKYHLESFIGAIPSFFKHYPDERPEWICEDIRSKSDVLYLGLPLAEITGSKKHCKPVLLWNHRWEYDKNPGDFLEILQKTSHLDYNINIIGENFRNYPIEFEKIKARFGERIIRWGYQKDRKEYFAALTESDILPVTTKQDFFGIPTAEAVYAGVHPLLPRRLAFPEIYRIEDNPDLFYDDLDEMAAKLEYLIENPEARRDVSSLVSPFDWRNIVEQYDDVLEAIAGKGE